MAKIYKFGSRSVFAIELEVPEDFRSCHMLHLYYWIENCKVGTQSLVDVYDLHSNFQRLKIDEDQWASEELYSCNPAAALNKIHLSYADEDGASWESVHRHNIWAHHVLGDCYFIAVSFGEKVKILYSPLATLSPVCVELPLLELKKIFSGVEGLLKELWGNVLISRQDSASRTARGSGLKPEGKT